MSRIRSIKPEWLDDENIVQVSSDARVLSIALILLADDYGNGRAAPVLLAGRVFPGKVLETLANALEELANIRFVQLYERDGQRYFAIRNWGRHQRVDKPGRAQVPGPLANIRETAANFREAPSTSQEIPAPLRDWKGGGGKGGGGEGDSRESRESARLPAPARGFALPESETQTQTPELTAAELRALFRSTWLAAGRDDPPFPAEAELDDLAERVTNTAAIRRLPPAQLFTSALEHWARSELNPREKRSPVQCFAVAFGEVVDQVVTSQPSAHGTLLKQRNEALRNGDTERYDALNAELRALNGGSHAPA
jgi:hypothetical protein